MVMVPDSIDGGEAGRLPALSPDGTATFEMYLAPESCFAQEMGDLSVGKTGPIASRMPVTVSGMAVVGASDAGRVRCNGELGPLWVVGRSAGAKDYASSLLSGIRAANDVADFLGRRVSKGLLISAEAGQGVGE